MLLHKVLKLDNLSKSYKDNQILKDVSITFEEDLLILLGENGSGKTTFFKCLLNLEEYKGNIISDFKKLFVIYDDTPFVDKMTGYDNIKLLALSFHIKDYKISNEFLNHEILKKKVDTYSYGQRKRLALTLVDIIKPDLLILDEVSNGLDYTTIKYLANKIKDWSKNSKIIIAGHQLEYYDKLINGVFYIKDKKIMKYEGLNEKLGDIYDEIY